MIARDLFRPLRPSPVAGPTGFAEPDICADWRVLTTRAQVDACYHFGMAISTKELFREALSLDDTARMELAGLLLESLDGDPEEGVEAAWLAEVERRTAELDSGAVASVPWTRIRSRLLGDAKARG